jgi:cytochrome P450
MMTVSTSSDLYYDPYDLEIMANPYPVFRRLREEAPLYYNDQHDFYAVSRFEDVDQGLMDHATFSSARGGVLEIIKANIEIPSGVFIFEDPPLHSVHRSLLSRVFTPRKMNALEPQIRRFCADVMDPLVGGGQFDFVTDLGAIMPMRVIGMLLGIPEQDQESIRKRGNARLRSEPGMAREFGSGGINFGGSAFFADYIDWRKEHPSDDLMTELIQAEFEDDTGEVRTLTREEIIIFVSILATAGNDTTNRLIGWTGKVLAEHPDQRRALHEDRQLIPNAIEELLRFEPPAIQICRTATRDVQYYGQTVPEGSVMMFLNGSANRDHRAFPPDGDVFDIRRKMGHHLAFGFGIHFCIGAALARLEGRIALDEVLNRFPEWDVDLDNAKLDSALVRGWQSLPTVVY